MPNVKIDGFRCSRCGHKWVPESKNRPVTCPNPRCRSAYWDKPRRKEGGHNAER